jgi:predicted transcriptional regulator
MVTTSITFRLDDDKIHSLRKLTEAKNVNMSTLVKYILSSYLEREFIYAKEEDEFVPTHKSVLRALFEKMSDEELRVMAVISANHFRDSALLNYGKFDMDDILSLTASRANRSGFTLRIFNDFDGDVETLVMQHNMGYRWSIFFTIFMMKLINDAGYATKSKLAYNGWSIELSKATVAKEMMSEMQYWPKYEFR